MPATLQEKSGGNSALTGWVPYGVLISVVFLLYVHVLYFDFVYCDDHILILNRADFLSHLSNLFQAFRQDAWGNGGEAYRPLVTVSYMVDSQAGQSPMIFHLSNVLIHLAASCLVFALLVEMKCRNEGALALAVLFAVHPVVASSVAWIPGRMDLLFGMFILSGFLFLLKFLRTDRKAFLALHVLFFLAALMAKETAVAFPLVCLLYVLLAAKKRWRPVILPAIGWAGSFLLWFILRNQAIRKNQASENHTELIQTFFGNLPVLIQQLGKVILPFNLSTLPVIEDTTFLYGLIGAAVLIAIVYRWSKDRSSSLFGILWFAAFLLPTYLVTVSGSRMHTDNRLYIPLVGSIFVLAQTNLFQQFRFRSGSGLFTLAGILLFAVLNFGFSKSYKNRFAFYGNAVQHSPHSVLALKGAGDNYFLQGDFGRAEIQYRLALALNPALAGIHMNLGLISMKKNAPAKAAEEFKEEIKVNPSSDKPYYNLALLYFQLGKIVESEGLLKKALQLNTGNWKADYQLGYLYARQGRFQEAKVFLQNAMQVNPAGTEAPKLLSLIEQKEKRGN